MTLHACATFDQTSGHINKIFNDITLTIEYLLCDVNLEDIILKYISIHKYYI